jgi:hypothetical protein
MALIGTVNIIDSNTNFISLETNSISANTGGKERIRITANTILCNTGGFPVSSWTSTKVPSILIGAGADISSTSIQNYPVGLAMYNSTNGEATGYGVAMKFHFSNNEVGKYSAIAGYASRTYGNGTGLRFYTNPTGENGVDNNAIRMQIDHSGSIGAGGSSTNIYNASDRRLKQNITPLSSALSKIADLNPVSFKWVKDFAKDENDKIMYGFVAQEVQEVDTNLIESFGPSSVYLEQEGTDELLEIDNPLRVNEKHIIALLVKGMQEQQEKIDALETRLAALEQ